ncbi:MAG TPA: glycine--tRNA ligase subunit beta [Candidatus Anoxymicrobiaceae bacterium]
MAELLLEIGTEELPASAAYDAIGQIERLVPELFDRERLVFEESYVLASPRRLSVSIRGLNELTEPKVTNRKGPPLSAARNEDGTWSKAALGFARSQGVGEEDLLVRDTDRGSYVFVVTEESGKPAAEALPAVLHEIVSSLRFKKSMRWGSGEERFSRPVRWLVALFDGHVIDFGFGELMSSDVTYGHRYLSEGAIGIKRPHEYEHLLREAFVMVDHEARLEQIVRTAELVCGEADAIPMLDDDVLEEVVMLVEWPGIVLGKFDERFLKLPREVLVHAMQAHQRYFPVEDRSGALKAGFLAVHNGDPVSEDIIRRGHERVLAARLADAEFFFEEDLKRPLADRMADLEHVVYQSELGSMAEKSARLALLVQKTALDIEQDEGLVERARRAALLSKCDLVTHMVIEFPALQGTVGSIYASLTGEDEKVAEAIGELYLPRRLGDSLPETTEGALLALAEKADNLAASFGLGHVPTGSEDPYALRRQALGMLMIIIDRGLDLSVSKMVRVSAAELEAEAHGFSWTPEAEKALSDFFVARERVFFTEDGYRYDLVDAVLAVDWDVPLSAQRRLDALIEARESGLLAKLYTAFERCHNLSKGQDTGGVDETLFTEEVELEVFSALVAAEEAAAAALEMLDFKGAAASIEPLCEPVDRLFNDVLIMAEDQVVRGNRLSLLARIDALFNRVADFSRLTWD